METNAITRELERIKILLDDFQRKYKWKLVEIKIGIQFQMSCSLSEKIKQTPLISLLLTIFRNHIRKPNFHFKLTVMEILDIDRKKVNWKWIGELAPAPICHILENFQNSLWLCYFSRNSQFFLIRMTFFDRSTGIWIYFTKNFSMNQFLQP